MTGRLRHVLALALGLFCGQSAFAQGWQLGWNLNWLKISR